MFVYWQYENVFLDIILLRGGSEPIQFFKHEWIRSVPSKQETLTHADVMLGSVAEDGPISYRYCVYVSCLLGYAKYWSFPAGTIKWINIFLFLLLQNM